MARQTVARGSLTFRQDITKEINWEWSPSGTEGEDFVPDPDDVFVSFWNPLDKYTYQVRDGRTVLRLTQDNISTFPDRNLRFHNFQGGYFYHIPGGVEITFTVYVDDAAAQANIDNVFFHCWVPIQYNNKTNTASSSTYGQVTSAVGMIQYLSSISWDTTGWTAGWYELKYRVPDGGNVELSVQPEGDPDDWKDIGYELESHHDPFMLQVGGNLNTGNPSSVYDFWKISVEAL